MGADFYLSEIVSQKYPIRVTKIFKRPKNCEDSSDFDDFRTDCQFEAQQHDLFPPQKWNKRNEQKVSEKLFAVVVFFGCYQ